MLLSPVLLDEGDVEFELEDVAEGELDVVELTEPPVIVGEPVSKMMPLLVAAPSGPLLVMVCRATSIGVGCAIALICSSRDRFVPALLLNVTSSFSELQLKALPENKPRRDGPSSATLKLLCAPDNRRGIALPTVASFVDPTLIVVQPAVLAVAHVLPE